MGLRRAVRLIIKKWKRKIDRAETIIVRRP